MIGRRTLCYSCKRLNLEWGKKPSCAAFPDGIPERIIDGGFDHRRPYPGDNDTRFVRDPDKPLPSQYPEQLDPAEPVFIATPEVPIRHQTRKELRATAADIIAALREKG